MTHKRSSRIAALVLRTAAACAAVLPLLLLPQLINQAHAEEPAVDQEPETKSIGADWIPFTDRAKTIEVKLPRTFDVSPEKASDRYLVVWSGTFDEPKSESSWDASLWVELELAYSSAATAAWFSALYSGPVIDGTTSSGTTADGAGWYRVAVKDGKYIRYFHQIENSGVVYEFQAVCSAKEFDQHRPAIEALLDSAAVIKERELPEPPEGWSVKKKGDLEVWTDSDDSKSINTALRYIKATRDALKKALKGKPRRAGPARVKLFRRLVELEEAAEAAGEKKVEDMFYDERDGSICISLVGYAMSDFDSSVAWVAARQAVRAHFGNKVPTWVSAGLMRYASYGGMEGAQAHAPSRFRIDQATPHIATSRPLPAYFDMKHGQITGTVTSEGKSSDNAQAARRNLWAWHMFFRHGKGGRKYRKLYTKSLETLYETGNPWLAHAVWDDVDPAEMLEDYQSWGAKW